MIIGGSHSAFSIAWLLINGPFRVNRGFDTSSDLARQQAKIGFKICPPKDPVNPYCDYTPGSVNFNIKILYRDKIKVYYQSQISAHADDYHDGDN